jgi:serine/threonine protein kinase/Tol biopolymer transport system component
VTAIFHDARARDVDARGAFLDEACRDDASLRADVDALLGADADPDRLDETLSDAGVQPSLEPGATFGQYRVLSLIGSGGMGHVYRAIDLQLQRPVALKLLAPELSRDASLGARLEREALVLASLNHPNIATIHGVEQLPPAITGSAGVRALVLEFIEGPTLSDRLRTGPLPLSEVLGYARQIAAALEAAHDRGIVHRDLKPGNLKIAPGGIVKVLDFGIAHISPSDVHAVTLAATDTGLVLGTPAYMSPEQARGLPIDKRTDVWAFGCVLFEMLTGRGAFAAATASDSLARIIEREPDWNAIPAATPAAIQRLIRRCLKKDPADRLHDIADARIEITDALSSPGREDATRATLSSGTRMTNALLGVAALGLVAAWLWWRPTPASTSPATDAMEFGVTFPNNAMPTEGLAVSPDGRRIVASVWTDSGDLWTYALDGSMPQRLPGGEGGGFPFWSPDGSTIAFFRGGEPSRPGELVTIAAAGGPATFLTNITFGGPIGGSWNRENAILFSGGGKISRVLASGGAAPVDVPLSGVRGRAGSPVFLPDGEHFVFCADRQITGAMYVASIDDGRAIELGESMCPGGFAPPDLVLFLRHGSLLAQKLDLHRFTLIGEARVAAAGVMRGALGPWPDLIPAASDAGAAVLAVPAARGGSSLGKLVWFDRNGKPAGAAIDPPASDVEYLNPAICPTNGNLVAANRFDPRTGTWHIWVVDVARGNAATRLTNDAASERDPVWSADGKAIVFASDRGGDLAFYRQSINGGNAERLPLDLSAERFPMLVDARDPIPSDWSSTQGVFFSQLQQSIWRAQVSDRSATQLDKEQGAAYGPHLSPDGKWLAYAAAPDGKRFDVFVERFPSGGLKKQITVNGGWHPRWTQTDRGVELVYWSLTEGIQSVPLRLTDQEIIVGAPTTLVREVLSLIDTRTAYDITRDGQRILVREAAGPPRPGIRVIVNWLQRMERE